LSALDKGLAKMDEAKRKKLEEMVQEAAKARRPGGAGAVKVPSRSVSRPASVRFDQPVNVLWVMCTAISC